MCQLVNCTVLPGGVADSMQAGQNTYYIFALSACKEASQDQHQGKV